MADGARVLKDGHLVVLGLGIPHVTGSLAQLTRARANAGQMG